MKLTANSVSFGYAKSDRFSLADINLAINEDERVAILGESGSGKSTLLSLLSGLTIPTQGRVMLDDRDVSHIPAHNRQFAFALQRPPALPGTTVFELLMRPALRNCDRATAVSAVSKVLNGLGLAGFENRQLSSLSGGQLQRVFMARALVWKPKFMLLDEPFNSIDVRLKHVVYPIILRHQIQCGSGMILVTHDPQEAMLLCERIVVICNGRILADLPTIKLLSEPPNIESARLIGGFATNFLEVSIEPESNSALLFRTAFGNIRGHLALVRPDSFDFKRKVIGLFPWSELIGSDPTKRNDNAESLVFNILQSALLSDSVPALYMNTEKTVYAQPPHEKIDQAFLISNSKNFLLYDQETGNLLGRAVLE